MKAIESFIIEKLHLRKDNTELKTIHGNVVPVSKIYDNVCKDYESKIDDDAKDVMTDWLEKNDVCRFKAYYTITKHLGGGINTAYGSFEHNPKKVSQLIDISNSTMRAMKCLFNRRGFVILIGDIYDDPLMLFYTPDTTFAIVKEK